MKKSDYIYYGLLIILIIGVIILITLMKNSTAQCIQNPYLYGASKMGDVQCNCYQFKNPLCPAEFSFNDTTFVSEFKTCGVDTSNIDFRTLNLT